MSTMNRRPIVEFVASDNFQSLSDNRRLMACLREADAEIARLRDALAEIADNRQNFHDRGDARDIALFHEMCDLANAALRPIP